MLAQVLALLYITGSLIHAVYQHRFTQEYYQKAVDHQQKHVRDSKLPMVGIIVPVHDVAYAVLDETLRSIFFLSYPKDRLKCFLVDDGSFLEENQSEERKKLDDQLAVQKILGWQVFTGHPNEGKRKAHNQAFQEAKKTCDYIYFVDGDSIPCEDIIEQFLAKMSDGVAGVCGNMGVSNPEASWLTKLLKIRYLLGTSVERVSESVFGHVWLVPGPASFYSTSFLEEVWDGDYQNQRYKGRLCTNGDDLRLTNCCNERGYRIAYAENAVVLTKVPEKLKDYLVQQARWNRDKYRDGVETLRSASKKGWYPLLAGVNRLVFPFLFLLTSVLCLIDLAVWGDLLSGGALTAMIFIRAMITYVSVRGIKGITTAAALQFTVVYGAISTILLLPVVKVWSFLTRGASTWKP